jgi:hypothetical protein
MMGRRIAFLVLMIAAAVGSTPAEAQCRLCDKPTTERDKNDGKDAIQLEVETSLAFDRLVLLGSGQGTAVIRPNGSSSGTGTVADVSPRAMVGTATVRGEPGRTIRVELPTRIELHSVSGGAITFDDVESDLPSLPRLDSSGKLTFRFGGRLKINGDADGDYRGDLPITAEYL